MAPKGSAFLYAHPDCQCYLEPLVVSWGWESEMPGESIFIDHHQWTGTHDPSACLVVPAALRFQEEHDWPAVRARCHELAVESLGRLVELTGLEPVYPSTADFFIQMFVAPLPPCDVQALKTRLYDDYCVEVPIIQWNGYTFVRPSLQGYNGRSDIDTLVKGLTALLPAVRNDA
jgi:isopenicillin-N epimerase